MTRKDFIKFADMLVEVYKDIIDHNEQADQVMEQIRIKIGDIFEADNPRFNRAKFDEYITDKTI